MVSPSGSAPAATTARTLATVWTSGTRVWLHPLMPPDTTVLLIGGRSGVGKTSVAAEASKLLQAAGVAHCLIDGDNLGAAYPKAPDDPHGSALAEANLRALWANYAAIGHNARSTSTPSACSRARWCCAPSEAAPPRRSC